MLQCLVYSLPISRLALGAVAAAIVPLCSCGRVAKTEETPLQITDSIYTNIYISASYPIKNLDLFVYSDSWTRQLEVHRFDTNFFHNTFNIPTSAGDKRLVIVANSPWRFNEEALRSYDSIELLQMSYADEDPEYPLMSGFDVFSAGDSLKIELSPLICPIEVLSVDNQLEGCTLLKRPKIRLEGVNASAELLRMVGFHPTETVESADELRNPQMMSACLPSDIGLYTQYPGITLYCYPIDVDPDDIAAVHTTLIFEAEACLTDGTTSPISRSWPLPTLHRGEHLALSLSIE